MALSHEVIRRCPRSLASIKCNGSHSCESNLVANPDQRTSIRKSNAIAWITITPVHENVHLTVPSGLGKILGKDFRMNVKLRRRGGEVIPVYNRLLAEQRRFDVGRSLRDRHSTPLRREILRQARSTINHASNPLGRWQAIAT